MLLGIVAVVVLNVFVLTSPAPQDGASQAADTELTLAILAFGGGDQDTIGDAIAEELRSEFKRRTNINVLGPETSRAIHAAGENRDTLASELGVTTILTGEASIVDGIIDLRARVHDASEHEIVWVSDYSVPAADGPELQAQIVNAVLDILIPGARAESVVGERISDVCHDVYEEYLVAKQVATRKRDRARELYAQVTEKAPGCGIAWEALALSWVDWTDEGFARAKDAAERALEINEALPGAWSVLAEIAEEEGRWNDSEWLFLKALNIDPSNGLTNAMYAEALLARGRVRDALHYALEGARYEPASRTVTWKAALIARYAGDVDLLLKYSEISAELSVSDSAAYAHIDETAEAHIMRGEIEAAARIYQDHPDVFASWHPRCVRSLDDPALREGLAPLLRETARQYRDGELGGRQGYFSIWNVIRCATWIGETDIVVDFMTAEDIPTEQDYFLFFQPDSGVLRQTEHFRNLVTDTGLLDYWREWGWSDYCRPDGDSFICD